MIHNTKKIEKLKLKISELDKRIKADTVAKSKYLKEIDEIESSDLLAFMRENNINYDDKLIIKFDIIRKAEENGIDNQDLLKLIQKDNCKTEEN